MNINTQMSIKDNYLSYKKENPKKRIRDISKAIGVTEAEVLHSFSGSSVMPLKNDFKALFERLHELGKVMVLTRNESCVHERKGVFEKVEVTNPHVGIVVGEDIDLRMFFYCWSFAYAVFDNEEAGLKKSIQIFDKWGNAIVKIYPQAEANQEAYDSLVRDFQQAELNHEITVAEKQALQYADPSTVDIAAFQQEWAALKDTHDFFPMMKKYKLSRIDAIRNGGSFVKKVQNTAAADLLKSAAASGLEIMVFVGNDGMIQIHTGKVEKILDIPEWVNVMDKDFNLHLRTTHIHETYMVKKPTEDGVVHSVECFDAEGTLIVQFFGKRKPGKPELTEWTSYALSLS
ncbi:hemin-degrading factor [Gynurincola endophyticus]|uniref:hemin-degrading factor n=1 Tax=Gynurincola endophyticus TaxID=2479004 RepID=UPI000F8CB23D|nr:ChuX/HutX family heme-like substrate-binding protein [Gynurincola endophyticus]